jgi:hypothetical protein
MAAQSGGSVPQLELTREQQRERERDFGHIQRRFDARVNGVVATLLPGDYYVAIEGEMISTVLGSCVSACIRDRRMGFGGMNHFMQTLGKPVGGDLKEGKVTLPLVYALETATSGERRQVETVLRDRTYDGSPFADIYSMIERRGGIQRTRERAQHFTDRARQLVAEFPDSPYQRALCTLTDLVTERDR